MHIEFEERSMRLLMETADWVVPPRVGEHIFLIGEADHELYGKRIGVQFDGVVTEVRWFGPHKAYVLFEQREGGWRPTEKQIAWLNTSRSREEADARILLSEPPVED